MKKIIFLLILTCLLIANEKTGIRKDSNTDAVIGIDYPHHEVHGGSHFTATTFNIDLDTAATISLLIQTADTTKESHMIFIIDGQLQTEVLFYEDTTHTAGVTLNSYNNNRNSSNTATTLINISNNDGSTGTLIFSDHFGIDTGGGVNRITGGGGSRADNEVILKTNSKYFLNIISFTDDNVVSVKLVWYEHTPKG